MLYQEILDLHYLPELLNHYYAEVHEKSDGGADTRAC
jgi:hypothetical protein